jgi:hypothetical protein
MGSRSYSFSGKLDATGSATKTIARSGLKPVSVELHLDLTSDQIRGNVTDGSWSAVLLSDKLLFNRTTRPAARAGTYTFVIPASAQSATSPAGDGIATVKVDSGGNILLAATLADGTKVAQKSTLSKQGIWPLYGSLYSGRGSVVSWLQFTNQPDSDLSGRFIWLRSAAAPGKYYPSGFTNEVWASGSSYTKPASGVKAFRSGDGALVLSGGGLADSLTVPFTWGSNNRITPKNSADKLSFTFTAASGLFRGSVLNPQTHKPVTFQGVLLDKSAMGAGFFLNTNKSGHVYLGSAP